MPESQRSVDNIALWDINGGFCALFKQNQVKYKQVKYKQVKYKQVEAHTGEA